MSNERQVPRPTFALPREHGLEVSGDQELVRTTMSNRLGDEGSLGQRTPGGSGASAVPSARVIHRAGDEPVEIVGISLGPKGVGDGGREECYSGGMSREL